MAWLDNDEGAEESTNLPAFSPLDIPYILQQIFKNLSTFHLCKSRMVCKYWEAEVTPVLSKRCKITIKSEQSLLDYEKLHPPLSQLCQCFDIKNEVKLKNPLTLQFFQKFGHSIKSLDISFHHEYGSPIISEILPHLTNLEELCLNGRAHFLYDEASRETLISCGLPLLKCIFIYDSSFDLNGFDPRRIWAENVFHLLANAQNLEKIYYAPFLESRAKMFFEILKCQPVQHDLLSHLHINHLWMKSEEISSLILKRYPLKYVHLVLTSQLDRSALNELLSKVRNTLRELTLTFTDGTSCLEFHPIGPLDKIRKLSMIGYDGPLIVNYAPSLKLFVMSLPENMISPEKVEINEELEELEIYDFHVKYDLDYLKVLFKKFSRLKMLKVNNVNNEILRVIYAYLPELCELRTCFHKFYGVASSRIDCGLNGLSARQLDEELLDIWDDRAVEHLRLNRWIGQLKHLKHLTLEVGLISDFGIVLGIARCKNLQELILKNTGSQSDSNSQDPRTILTDRTLRSISDMESLNYLKIEGFLEMFTEKGIQAAKETLDGREVLIV